MMDEAIVSQAQLRTMAESGESLRGVDWRTWFLLSTGNLGLEDSLGTQPRETSA